MSIKTMKQRIALVAVTALTAGVLSVASAPVANAAVTVGEIDFAAATSLGVNSGMCTFTNTDALGTTVGTGLVGSIVTLVKPALNAAGDPTYLAISGPANFIDANVSAGGTTAGTLTPTTFLDGTSLASDRITLRLNAVGTVSVAYGSSATANPVDTITITVVTTCANGVWSATNSFVQMSTTAAGNADSNVDAATSTTAGTPMYIKLKPVDGYASAITTGTLFASATNGALVSWGAAAAGFPAGAGSVATATPTANHQLRVDPASSATTSTTVVTITLNGVAVATKNITFHGEQAKIVVGTVYAGKTSDADDGTVLFTYQDTAGNTVPGNVAAIVAASAGTRITTANSIKAPTTTSDAINVNDVIEAKLGGKASAGVMTYACGSSAGTADFTIATTSTVNANTLTATVKGMCYGGISTYTVSTDKAAYKIGEVAVITIEAKDSSGNPVADSSKLQASSVSVGGGSLTYTLLGTDAAGAVEGFQGGKVTLRAQMTTEGTFNTVVSLTGAATSAATTGYSVSTATTSVSNAQVLQSIVALIASINKQIQALQKLILARR